MDDPLSSFRLDRYVTGFAGRECNPGPCRICVVPVESCVSACEFANSLQVSLDYPTDMTAPPGGTAVAKVPLTCNWKGTVDVSSDGATRNGTTVDSVRFTFTVDANDTHSFLVESLDASGDVIVTTSYAETSHEPCVLESMTRQSGDLTWGANAVMIEEGA